MSSNTHSLGDLVLVKETVDHEAKSYTASLFYKKVKVCSISYDTVKGLRLIEQRIVTEALEVFIMERYNNMKTFLEAEGKSEMAVEVGTTAMFEDIVSHLNIWLNTVEKLHEAQGGLPEDGVERYLMVVAMTKEPSTLPKAFYNENMLFEVTTIETSNFSEKLMYDIVEEMEQLNNAVRVGIGVYPTEYNYNISWEEYAQFIENPTLNKKDSEEDAT